MQLKMEEKPYSGNCVVRYPYDQYVYLKILSFIMLKLNKLKLKLEHFHILLMYLT